MAAYPRLKQLEVLLTSDDISNLSRQLHTVFRLEKNKEGILPYAQMVIADIQSGAVPGHPLASVHLLSLLKDMEEFEIANAFWQWLRTQDETHTDARVYGAMIETLAFNGEPLRYLEDLYSEAFERYSNTQEIAPEKAKETGATRIMLLQGIITARLLNGEWRGAYEAFDLVLRLYPTATPSRIYELFIYERPVREGYIAFLMACRAGTPLKPGVLTPLLSEIWKQHRDVAAMIRAVWAFVGAGGTVTVHHLNAIIRGILLSYPAEPWDDTPEAKAEHSRGFYTLLSYARECIAAFCSLGIQLEASTFNTLMICGGKLKRGDLVLGGLRDMLAAKVKPSAITYRTLVLVSGELNDAVQLEESWTMIIASREDEKQRILEANMEAARLRGEDPEIAKRAGVELPWDFKDWQALINAGTMIGHSQFVRDEIAKYTDSMGSGFYYSVMQYFGSVEERRLAAARRKMNEEMLPREAWDKMLSDSSPEAVPSLLAFPDDAPPLDSANGDVKKPRYTLPTDLAPELGKLLHIFTSPTVTPFSPSAPGHIAIDLELSAPQFPPLPDSNLQEIYDSLLAASDKTRLAGLSPRFLDPPDDAPPTVMEGTTHAAIGATGFTLRELRFMNWVAVNKLLFEAELHERRSRARYLVEIQKAKMGELKDAGEMGIKYHFWREPQIRERIRRARMGLSEMKPEEQNVDVNVRTGRVTRRYSGRVVDAVKAREGEREGWEIRKILGGGGVAFVREEEVKEGKKVPVPADYVPVMEEIVEGSEGEVLKVRPIRLDLEKPGVGKGGPWPTVLVRPRTPSGEGKEGRKVEEPFTTKLVEVKKPRQPRKLKATMEAESATDKETAPVHTTPEVEATSMPVAEISPAAEAAPVEPVAVEEVPVTPTEALAVGDAPEPAVAEVEAAPEPVVEEVAPTPVEEKVAESPVSAPASAPTPVLEKAALTSAHPVEVAEETAPAPAPTSVEAPAEPTKKITKRKSTRKITSKVEPTPAAEAPTPVEAASPEPVEAAPTPSPTSSPAPVEAVRASTTFPEAEAAPDATPAPTPVVKATPTSTPATAPKPKQRQQVNPQDILATLDNLDATLAAVQAHLTHLRNNRDD